MHIQDFCPWTPMYKVRVQRHVQRHAAHVQTHSGQETPPPLSLSGQDSTELSQLTRTAQTAVIASLSGQDTRELSQLGQQKHHPFMDRTASELSQLAPTVRPVGHTAPCWPGQLGSNYELSQLAGTARSARVRLHAGVHAGRWLQRSLQKRPLDVCTVVTRAAGRWR